MLFQAPRKRCITEDRDNERGGEPAEDAQRAAIAFGHLDGGHDPAAQRARRRRRWQRLRQCIDDGANLGEFPAAFRARRKVCANARRVAGVERAEREFVKLRGFTMLIHGAIDS
jgi:hypothetical protein